MNRNDHGCLFRALTVALSTLGSSPGSRLPRGRLDPGRLVRPVNEFPSESDGIPSPPWLASHRAASQGAGNGELRRSSSEPGNGFTCRTSRQGSCQPDDVPVHAQLIR